MRTVLYGLLMGLSVGACASASTSDAIDRELRELASTPSAPAPGPAEPSREPADEPTLPVPDNPDDTVLAGPVTPETLVALAIERSPRLRADVRALRVLLYEARAETALPPPELMAEIWNTPLTEPWALGKADMLMLEVRQTWPAPGGRDARANAIVAEVHARTVALAESRRALALRVTETFAAYAHAVRGGNAHREHGKLLERMSAVVRARLAAGGASLADVTRVDFERARLRADIGRLDAEAEGARGRLNALLGRTPDALLGPPGDSMPMKTAPLGVLLARAKAARGMILAAKARVLVAERERDAADADASWPAMTLGLGYWQDPSSRPGIGLSFGITLPWLSGAARDRVQAAQERIEAARAEVDASEFEVAAAVSDAFADVQMIRKALASLKEQTLPLSERTVKAVAASYSAGGAGALDWIDAARSVLELHAEKIDLEAELAVAVARLELAVGDSASEEVMP